MKTAIQELMDEVEIHYNNRIEISMSVFYGMLKRSLHKEREQIQKAFEFGSVIGSGIMPIDSEEYYTQTYKTDNK